MTTTGVLQLDENPGSLTSDRSDCETDYDPDCHGSLQLASISGKTKTLEYDLPTTVAWVVSNVPVDGMKLLSKHSSKL